MKQFFICFIFLFVFSMKAYSAKFKCDTNNNQNDKDYLNKCVKSWLEKDPAIKKFYKENYIIPIDSPKIYTIKAFGDGSSCGKKSEGIGGEVKGTLLIVLSHQPDPQFITTSAIKAEYTKTDCKEKNKYTENAWIDEFSKLDLL